MRIPIIYYISLFLIFFSCSKKNQVDKQQENKSSIVVFEQALYPLDFKIPFKDIKPVKTDTGVISYVVGDSVVYYNPKKGKDTLLLNNPNHYVALRFDCLFEDYCYLIAPNDTVSFSVDEYGRATLKSKTSERLTKLYNLPYEGEYDTQFLCYRPLTGLLSFPLGLPHFSKIFQERIVGEYEGVEISIVDLEKSYRSHHKKFGEKIEGLTKKDSIPKEFIDYFHYRKGLDDYSFMLSKYFSQREEVEKKELTSFFNDDYLTYPSYYKAITVDYLRKYFYKKDGVAVIKQSNGSSPDWRDFYDKIKKESYPVKTKNVMLKYLLKNMTPLFSVKDIQSYLDDYVERTGDKVTVEAIVNPFDLTASEKELSSKSLLLKDMQGKVQTLEQILEENKGYVVYLDFWASWCMPCRSLMPDSKKLHEKYADKKVKFLYFSIDGDEKAWKKAVMKDKLEENSFLVVNTEKPAFIEEINLGPIPRYLVFNKNGKLVEKDAPRPNQGKIETIFDKYLE